MADLNVFAVQGRLTADAELSYIGAKNTPKLSFSLANNTGWGDYKHANFFRCEMLGKGAEAIEEYMVKGKQLNATGEIKQERWESDSGKRSMVKLSVRNIYFIADGTGQKESPTSEKPSQRSSDNPFQNMINNNKGKIQSEEFDDDIPF